MSEYKHVISEITQNEKGNITDFKPLKRGENGDSQDFPTGISCPPIPENSCPPNYEAYCKEGEVWCKFKV